MFQVILPGSVSFFIHPHDISINLKAISHELGATDILKGSQGLTNFNLSFSYSANEILDTKLRSSVKAGSKRQLPFWR